jgi:Zn-dependent M28 family amino/carboxypeptidase
VVLSAHYDHVGAHQVPPGQDGIWNGADDNASGTAAVLELARELAARPGKRSVLVFFTSGEDRGIFGSAVYGDEPVVPMKQVAVQLNLDMIGRSDGSVQAIAPIAPQLFDEAVSVGRRHGVRAVPDQQPAWRVLYLTDNYHFARMGVPGIFFFTGVHADYHQPTDTADKINYHGMARIVRLAAEMARGYADGRKRPAFVRPKWFLTPD